MIKVSEFLGIKPRMYLWKKLRTIKGVQTASNVKDYIKQEQKVFILGGRSGTTLMQKLLMVSGKYKNWHRRNKTFNPDTDDPIQLALKRTQAPYGRAIIMFDTYPDVPDNILNPMDEFTLAKLPEFDLIIDKIIKRYKNPIFVIMERDVKSIALSHMRAGMGRGIKREVLSNKKFAQEFKKLLGELPNGVWLHDEILFWRFLIETREKKLIGYNKDNIYRIDFDTFMNDFESVMYELSKFLKIEPTIEIWNDIRRVRTSRTASNVTKYIKDKKVKEIVPDHCIPP